MSGEVFKNLQSAPLLFGARVVIERIVDAPQYDLCVKQIGNSNVLPYF